MHDPDETCNCEPNDLAHKGICEYRLLADEIAELFNPPDNDVAEVAILIDAAKAAQDYIISQLCSCTPEMVADWDACPRCRVLGRIDDMRVQR